MTHTCTNLKTDSDNALRKALSDHAQRRMNARNLGLKAIKAALDFGRIVYTKGAIIYVIGKKEVRRFKRSGIDLRRFEGVHVVCAPSGKIITTYRNRSFRGLRPGLYFPRSR